MAKLFLRNAYEFENPSRRIFLAGELFEGSGAQAKKTEAWVKGKESSPEAIALAKRVAEQAEEIREGTKKELLELYVNLFTTGPIANKESFNAAPFTVDSTYAKNGLLQTLEKNSPDLRITFKGTEDLRLLAYATVYSNFKEQGLDANYLPIGAEVTLMNGYVTVTYTENGVVKTATSELFPWSTYEIAHQKYADLMHAEAVVAGEEAERRGIPIDIDGDGIHDVPAEAPRVPGTTPTEVTPPAPVESEEMIDETGLNPLDTEWSVIEPLLLSLQSQHPEIKISAHESSLRTGQINRTKYSKIIEVTNTRTGDVYRVEVNVPIKDRPTSYSDERVRISIQRHTPSHENEGVNLLDGNGETLSYSGENRVYNTVKGVVEAMTKGTELEKDWRIVLANVQQMVAADNRLAGVVTVSEGPRNVQGADKTIIVKNVQTGDRIFYMVGVKEQKDPKTYGPRKGAPDDAARVEDAKAIRITFLTIGNGFDNKAIGRRVSKYNHLADYATSSVEKGAYNAALIIAGIDPIEEPASPTLMEVIFKGHEKGSEKPDREPREPRVRDNDARLEHRKAETYPLARIDQVPDLLKVYPERIQEPVNNITDTPPFFGKVKQVGPNLLADADAGLATYYVQLETNDGQQVSVSVHPDQITDAQVNAYIRVNGGSLPEGVTHDDVKQYLAYNQLENQLAKELVKAETQLQRIIDKMPASSPAVPEAVPATVEIDHEKLLSTAADTLSIGYAWTPEVVRDSSTYGLMNANASVKALADAYPSYLQITSTKIVAPAADGSAEWTATLTTADGETIVVHATTPPIDQAVVDIFIKEKAALGLTYSKADVIRHAAYRNVGDAFATAIETAKTENKLDEKYDKYKKRLARTEPVAAVAPSETPTPTPRVTESQWSRELAASLNEEDEFPAVQDIAPLSAESINTAPETYELQLRAEAIKDGYTGKGTWGSPHGLSSSYMGNWLNGVPNGEGFIFTDDGGKLGPIQFDEGRATFKKPDGEELIIEWIPDQMTMLVID